MAGCHFFWSSFLGSPTNSGLFNPERGVFKWAWYDTHLWCSSSSWLLPLKDCWDRRLFHIGLRQAIVRLALFFPKKTKRQLRQLKTYQRVSTLQRVRRTMRSGSTQMRPRPQQRCRGGLIHSWYILLFSWQTTYFIFCLKEDQPWQKFSSERKLWKFQFQACSRSSPYLHYSDVACMILIHSLPNVTLDFFAKNGFKYGINIKKKQ